MDIQAGDALGFDEVGSVDDGGEIRCSSRISTDESE